MSDILDPEMKNKYADQFLSHVVPKPDLQQQI